MAGGVIGQEWAGGEVFRRRVSVTPAIRAALVISILAHVAALWPWLPQLLRPAPDVPERGVGSGALIVELAPPPAPPPAPALAPREQRPVARAPRRERAPAPRQARPPAAPRAPAIALETPAPRAPPAAPAAPRAGATPAPGGDLSSYIESRRRARQEEAAPAPVPSAAPAPPQAAAAPEDESTRANRIAAANLGYGRKPVFGAEPVRGGGVFDIRRVGYDSAEFVFFGWNKDIRRNTAQLIEVRRGAHGDIRLAVVRRMISIIRENEQGDFVWDSKRLGHNVVLSARPRDDAGLEEFLLQEFFSLRPR
jgi:hypothetical protein